MTSAAGQSLINVGAGLAIGLAASLPLMRTLASQLSGVTPYGTLTYFAVPAVLLAAAGAACLVPLRRAARIEALDALRI